MADSSSEDAGNVLKGQVDSVYEAKAMVLNRAVSQSNGYYLLQQGSRSIGLTLPPDSANWHGVVSMAAVHCRGFRLGLG